MKFTKEQQDYLKHCGEHFEILTGGRGHSKTKEVIEDMQQEIERLQKELDKTRLSELDKEYRISKAIKYINGHKEYLKRLDEQGAYYSTIEVRMCDEMIRILKGEE